MLRFVSPLEMGLWSMQGMCLERVCSNFLEPTHTCPSSWAGILPPAQSYSKTDSTTAGSIFSCIIYLNTCLTTLYRASSVLERKGFGTPKNFFPCDCICQSMFTQWPRAPFLCLVPLTPETRWMELSKEAPPMWYLLKQRHSRTQCQCPAMHLTWKLLMYQLCSTIFLWCNTY